MENGVSVGKLQLMMSELMEINHSCIVYHLEIDIK